MENACHIWRLKLKNIHQKRQTTCQNIQTLHFLYGSFHDDYQQTACAFLVSLLLIRWDNTDFKKKCMSCITSENVWWGEGIKMLCSPTKRHLVIIDSIDSELDLQLGFESGCSYTVGLLPLFFLFSIRNKLFNIKCLLSNHWKEGKNKLNGPKLLQSL